MTALGTQTRSAIQGIDETGQLVNVTAGTMDAGASTGRRIELVVGETSTMLLPDAAPALITALRNALRDIRQANGHA